MCIRDRIGVSLVVLIGVQVFGTVFDALVSMGIKPPEKLSMLAGSSPETLNMLKPYLDQVREMTQAAIAPDVIAFCYQFGYLVLPAITPVSLWVAFNQAFIKNLITIEVSELPDVGTSSPDSKS